MPQIVVNGVAQSAECSCQRWGEQLEVLDRQVAGDGLVLTAVRFDGVDQPSFRDPACALQLLGSVRVVEADSARPRDLLESSVREAVAAAEALAAGARRVGDGFRGFDVSQANQDLVELARGLGTLVAILQALGHALGVSLDSLKCGDRTASRMIQELTAHADGLIDAQRAGDWITVADTVEYDLAPALEEWPKLFTALRGSIQA
jgi:hypothetical protein